MELVFQRIVKMNKSEDQEMDNEELSEEEVLALAERKNMFKINGLELSLIFLFDLNA